MAAAGLCACLVWDVRSNESETANFYKLGPDSLTSGKKEKALGLGEMKVEAKETK